MDFSQFDVRNYPTTSVESGYGEWAATYEDVVLDAMDLRLFARVASVPWSRMGETIDLACGTGRIGVWLKGQGVGALDGLDLTPQMLEKAAEKGVYRELYTGNVLAALLETGAYDLATISLADEHFPDVAPFYSEAARITRPDGYLVIVGFHPFFLMNGVPTHYNSASSGPLTISTYVHLFSDHVRAALAAGWTLIEMHEGLVDADWLARKPKWRKYENRPVSFVMAWRKG